jgi:hypothetical protein
MPPVRFEPTISAGRRPQIYYVLDRAATGTGTYTYLLHGAESFLKGQPVFAASQEIPRIFMEPEGSLPYSQVPATCPYPEPTPFSPHNPLQLPEKSILISSSHLRLGLLNGLFPSGYKY